MAEFYGLNGKYNERMLVEVNGVFQPTNQQTQLGGHHPALIHAWVTSHLSYSNVYQVTPGKRSKCDASLSLLQISDLVGG